MILFGALYSISDKRKGAQLFFEALKILRTPKKYQYAIFGANDYPNSYKLDDNNIKCLGYLRDNISLALAYSAADVFVAPSLQEAFGKTLVESMACGTPVVAFNATGPKDIITHKSDGYLAQACEAKDLAEGIEWILEDKRRRQILSNNAREKVQYKFSLDIIVKKYADLYAEILKKK